MEDHGEIGAEIIENDGILKALIPNTRIYDEDVQKAIKLHSKINDTLEKSIIGYIKLFKNYELKELFLSKNTEKEREFLCSINNAITQDSDRLDIFRKIVKGIWIPKATNESIDKELFELFKKGQLPSMNEIKRMGKWNENVGHMVRMSFIDQMNLATTLRKIKNEHLIEKIYNISGNNNVEPIYEIAKEKLNKTLENSEDGIVLVKSKI